MEISKRLKLNGSERFREQFPRNHISSKVANANLLDQNKIRPSMFSSMMNPNEYAKDSIDIKVQSPERLLDLSTQYRNSCIETLHANSPQFELEDLDRKETQFKASRSIRYSKKSITRQEFKEISHDQRTRNISIPKEFIAKKLLPDLDRNLKAERIQTGAQKFRNIGLDSSFVKEFISRNKEKHSGRTSQVPSNLGKIPISFFNNREKAKQFDQYHQFNNHTRRKMLNKSVSNKSIHQSNEFERKSSEDSLVLMGGYTIDNRKIRAKLDFNKVKIFKENTIIPFDISL